MFFKSRWLPLLLSIVKAKEKSYKVPNNLPSQTSTAYFPATSDTPETYFLKVLFTFAILKAAAVQVIPVRSLTVIFKDWLPTAVYEVPLSLWSVRYILYLFKAGSLWANVRQASSNYLLRQRTPGCWSSSTGRGSKRKRTVGRGQKEDNKQNGAYQDEATLSKSL